MPFDTELASLMKAPGALFRGWRHSAPSPEGLRSLGRRMSTMGLCAPENQPERKRGRERERKQDTETKALMEQRCFNQHGVGIYIVVILSKDKD